MNYFITTLCVLSSCIGGCEFCGSDNGDCKLLFLSYRNKYKASDDMKVSIAQNYSHILLRNALELHSSTP